MSLNTKKQHTMMNSVYKINDYLTRVYDARNEKIADMYVDTFRSEVEKYIDVKNKDGVNDSTDIELLNRLKNCNGRDIFDKIHGRGSINAVKDDFADYSDIFTSHFQYEHVRIMFNHIL